LTPRFEGLQLCYACNCLVTEPFAVAAVAKVAGTQHLSICCKGEGTIFSGKIKTLVYRPTKSHISEYQSTHPHPKKNPRQE